MNEIGDSLGSQIARLVKRGAHRFDPVRFSYIQSLARRSRGKKEAVARIIERKAIDAIHEYLLRFEKARREAEGIVARVSIEYPESRDEIRGFFGSCQFKEVRRLAERLDMGRPQTVLAKLTERLTTPPPGKDESQLTFDDRLKKQEDEIGQSIGNPLIGERPVRNTYKTELRSFHLFKKTWSKIYADNLVTQAIKDRPEDPGPLNGQMLATLSLSAMRNLSPSYLDRFVSHFESLLWLEEAG